MAKTEMPFTNDVEIDRLLCNKVVKITPVLGNVTIYTATSKKLSLPTNTGFDEYSAALNGLNAAWLAKDGKVFILIQAVDNFFYYHIALLHAGGKKRKCMSIKHCLNIIEILM